MAGPILQNADRSSAAKTLLGFQMSQSYGTSQAPIRLNSFFADGQFMYWSKIKTEFEFYQNAKKYEIVEVKKYNVSTYSRLNVVR